MSQCYSYGAYAFSDLEDLEDPGAGIFKGCWFSGQLRYEVGDIGAALSASQKIC